MAYTHVPVERFAPLNLRDDPTEVGWGGAVDLLNVDFDDAGRLGTRAGSTKLNSGAFTSGTAYRVFEWEFLGGRPLRYSLSGTTVTIDVLESDGTDSVFSTWTGLGTGGAYSSHAFIGTSTDPYLFIAQAYPAQSPNVMRIDSSGTDTASVGSCYWVAAWQNRLVQANIVEAPAGSETGDDLVFFSGAGTPETYDATDYIHVGINDGETIAGMVAWREMLFVVKQSRMFVFYGTSVDSTGGAVFNYRTVDLPARFDNTVADGVNSVVAGPDGVYLALADGLYVSTGGVPVEVSQVVRPLFTRSAGASLRRDSAVSLDNAGGRIFCRYTNDSASATRTLVYDPAFRSWTIWGLAAVVNLFEHRQSDGGHVLYWADQSNVYRLDSDVATDNGTAIASHYQSGRLALARGEQADVRDFDVYGSGTVALALAADGGSVNSTANGDGTVAGAVSTALAAGLNAVNVGATCRDLAFRLSASSGLWTVDRLSARVRGVRDWT